MVLSLSFIVGALFGAIFGIVDVEDYSNNKMVLYVVLQTEISLCEPLGAVFGAFGGFMLEFLRQQELEHRETTFGRDDSKGENLAGQDDTSDEEALDTQQQNYNKGDNAAINLEAFEVCS